MSPLTRTGGEPVARQRARRVRRRGPGKRIAREDDTAPRSDPTMTTVAADATCAGAESDRGSPAAWSTPRAHRGVAGGFRRLRIRDERSSERFYALAMLACAVICFNILQQPPW